MLPSSFTGQVGELQAMSSCLGRYREVPRMNPAEVKEQQIEKLEEVILA